MKVVHGSFVPHGPAGFFFVWAMEPGFEGPPAGRAMGLHPHAAAPDLIWPLLQGIPAVHDVTCVLPVPGPKRTVPFKLPGLGLSVGAAALWLLDLDETFAGNLLRPGRTLRAWSSGARLLLEFLSRGRFVPSLAAEAGCLAADWRLALTAEEDRARLDQLAAALPGACRALIPPDRDRKTYRPPGARELIDQFLRSATGALAQQLLEGAVPPDPRAVRATAAHHWVLGLTGCGKRDLPPGLHDGAALYEAVDAWAAPVSGVRGHGALQAGLRLCLPDETSHGGWEVELLLQTSGDPPVTLPAQRAWEQLGQEIIVGSQRYSHAEQRLLADLPAMARLYPPLEPLRQAAAPARLKVDEAAVLHLLQESAPLLNEAGFPVFLPGGLVRTAALKAKVHLKPAGGASEARFGLNQLVQVDWDVALGDMTLGYSELSQLADLKRPLVQYQGQWVQVDQRSLETALKRMEQYREPVALGQALRVAGGAAAGKAAKGTAPPSEELPVVEASSEGWVADLLARLREPARVEHVPLPDSFSGTLRPYQQRGLDWLIFLRRFGLGACLADDMGLGKTVQMTASLLTERTAGLTDMPTLLVCPVSLVGNWRREIQRFAPDLKLMIHHGAGRAAQDSFAARAMAHDVVITTYSVVARDEAELEKVPWAGVVADEAQALKNPNAKHAQVLRRLPAGYRVALTGTPVENHLGDLWALFAFMNPGYLGGHEEFRKSFAIPIERFRDEEAVDKLRRLVQPFILRRLKTDPTVVQDLPEKLETVVYANLTVEQASLYEAVVQEMLERVESATGIARHGAVLAGLTKLKQVCNHPVGLTGDAGPLAGRSGKLDRLCEMLEEAVAEGDNSLVFTQFAQFGAKLKPFLERRLGCPVLFMDGSAPREERERLIASFQAGEAPVFVLSIKSGGVGLNLTAATQVFHLDRWWNPAVEDQATDRAYRIGQTRTVLVYKLVTAGTLEERIDQLLAEKRLLASQVISAGEGWVSNLSTDELRSLITLERE